MSALDTKTLELMASKICHDLISPIGAINNGLEIFEELGPDAGADVTELIASSAQLASAKLQAYRIAYGAGGADSTIKPADAHKALESILAHEKRLSQDWDPQGNIGIGAILPRAFSKMLTTLLMLITECLPRGGVISVEGGDGTTKIIARGEGAQMRDGFEDCLHGRASLGDLSPALTHAFMSGLLIKHYNYELVAIHANGEEAVIEFRAPAE